MNDEKDKIKKARISQAKEIFQQIETWFATTGQQPQVERLFGYTGLYATINDLTKLR